MKRLSRLLDRPDIDLLNSDDAALDTEARLQFVRVGGLVLILDVASDKGVERSAGSVGTALQAHLAAGLESALHPDLVLAGILVCVLALFAHQGSLDLERPE